MFLLKTGLSTVIIGSIGLIKATLLSWSKYFYIWLGIKVLVSLYYWFYNASSEKITIFVLIFTIMLNAILTDLRVIENKEYGFDVMIKSLDCIIEERFNSKKEYKYIADKTRLIIIII